MASIYKHGVYAKEQPTSMVAPITGTAGLQVIVGTAPVHMLEDPSAAVNKPLLVNTYKEAVAAVGYSDDFEAYTLCESISANFSVVGVAPLVLINVLDPAKHSTDLAETTAQVNDGVAVVAETGILLDKLVVKSGDVVLKKDTDYITAWSSDGSLNIVLVEGGAGSNATSLTVTGKRLDPSKVTAADIVGGVNINTGAETGLEVIRQIRPKFSMTPGILLAPRFSAAAVVAAALQAKTKEINGAFKAVCIVDVDSGADGARKYDDVKEQKEKQALTDPNAFGVWLYGKVGDVLYSGSTLAAALTAYTDAANEDTPNVSPSNNWEVGGEIEYNAGEEQSDLDYSSMYEETSPAANAASNAAGAVPGGAAVLTNAPFYYGSGSTEPSCYKSGTYYFYDGILVNGRYRMTITADRCGKLPVAVNVTGWVPASYCISEDKEKAGL